MFEKWRKNITEVTQDFLKGISKSLDSILGPDEPKKKEKKTYKNRPNIFKRDKPKKKKEKRPRKEPKEKLPPKKEFKGFSPDRPPGLWDNIKEKTKDFFGKSIKIPPEITAQEYEKQYLEPYSYVLEYKRKDGTADYITITSLDRLSEKELYKLAHKIIKEGEKKKLVKYSAVKVKISSIECIAAVYSDLNETQTA